MLMWFVLGKKKTIFFYGYYERIRNAIFTRKYDKLILTALLKSLALLLI